MYFFKTTKEKTLPKILKICIKQSKNSYKNLIKPISVNQVNLAYTAYICKYSYTILITLTKQTWYILPNLQKI